MKRLQTLGILMLLLIGTATVSAQTVCTLSKGQFSAVKWMDALFAKGKVPPFSFCMNNIPSKQFITKWKYTVTNLPAQEEHALRRCYTYQEPTSGLTVACEVTAYTDFNAIEWVLRFTNKSATDSGQISNVKESDVDFLFPQKGTMVLHYAKGSMPGRDDFAPQDKNFDYGDSLVLQPTGGRSSHLTMPFFNIESPASGQGIMAAIGWTGVWKADLKATSACNFTMKSGLAVLDTYLKPQESIRTASVCLLFWKSKDRFDGHNQFRRFITAHHTRKIDNKPAKYPYFLGFSWGDPEPCNEYSCLTAKMAKAILERQQMFHLQAEANWLDAGWFEGADRYEENKNWANTVGNWKVNKEHFPNGLKEVADEVHRLGRKFMVWFEPERVYEGSAWDKDHSEWLLKLNNEPSRLFNLGNDAACKWLCQFMGDFLESNGIDYYRQDFNIHPEPFWRAYDEQGRKGMTEVKYIMGLYKYWDYLLNRFPRLLIDNCASGGMRLDWETTLRSAPMWRTDDCYYNDPSDMQCHTYGINLFLPQSGTGMGLPDRTDKTSLRSSMGSSMIFNWKIMTHNESFPKMLACQQEYLEVRPYFMEDYYPLTGTQHTDAKDNWLAYQLNRPSDSSGYLIAFRHHDNKETSVTLYLHALSDDLTYVLTNKDTGESMQKTGKELKEEGLKLTLNDVDSSLLIHYKKM